MTLSDTQISLSEMLLARAVDELAFIGWTKTKDGSKNRNRPQSVVKALTKQDKSEEVQSFRTPDDFRAAWNDIIGRSAENG